ncbi:GTPase-activating protein SAC7, partial [Tremellales sp. Uapishka_1]
MVSTRPSPAPAKGRIAYPSATGYTAGDAHTSPTYEGESSQPLAKVVSPQSASEREKNVQGLKTWWKGFGGKADEPTKASDVGGVFGVPLHESLEYASVQISTAGPDGELYVWGAIPVVVAKCGLHLKEAATEVEGTFRISGSAKRMKELQTVFDTGPRYGKDVDWKTVTYTTHDVATIFRRNPSFPLISITRCVGAEKGDSPAYNLQFRNVMTQEISLDEAVKEYKSLIRAMPSCNQYLLLYILDLLSVFAKKSDINLMTAPMLNHPLHHMQPREHVLSQRVLEFLIEHQDHFLLGMQLASLPVNRQTYMLTRRLQKPRKHKKREQKSPVPSSPLASSSPVPLSPVATSPPQPPPFVRADSDLMLPSDSDDEAPAGGYYIMEAHKPPRTALAFS